MSETVVTKVISLERQIDQSGARPTIRYRLEAETTTGRLVLQVTANAAQELKGLLAGIPPIADSR